MFFLSSQVNLKLEENLVKRIALLKSSGAHILFDYLTLSIEFPSSHYTVLRLVEKITDGDEAQIKLRKRKAELSCVRGERQSTRNIRPVDRLIL